MRRVADTLYFEGMDAAQALVDTTFGSDEMADRPDEARADPDAPSAPPASVPEELPAARLLNLGPMGLFTRETHGTIGILWRILTAIGAVLLLLAALFSRGFGRLGTPGVGLAVAAVPIAAASSVASRQLNSMTAEDSGIAADLVVSVNAIVSGLSGTYLLLAEVGAAVAFFALVGTVASYIGPKALHLARARLARMSP